jgi:hypothetical protein
MQVEHFPLPSLFILCKWMITKDFYWLLASVDFEFIGCLFVSRLGPSWNQQRLPGTNIIVFGFAYINCCSLLCLFCFQVKSDVPFGCFILDFNHGTSPFGSMHYDP